MPTSRLTWAALLGLVSVCGSTVACTSSAGGACDTFTLPKTDPCYGKSCCDMVKIPVDAGVTADSASDAGDAGDAGPAYTYRLCGACNG